MIKAGLVMASPVIAVLYLLAYTIALAILVIGSIWAVIEALRLKVRG